MLLSIITVNLNNKEGFERTARSISQQKFKDFEWVIIDGGSTDGSTQIIEKYQEYVNYWVSEKDKGIYHAMNKGISRAKGKYLLFLNSGDTLYHSTSLEQVAEKLKKENADVFYTDIQLIDYLKKEAYKEVYPEKIKLNYLIHNSLCHQGVIFTKQIFNVLGLYKEEYLLLSDWMFYFETFKKGYTFTKLENIVLSNFYLHGFSSDYHLCKKERRDFLEKYYPEHLAEYDFINRERTILERIWIRIKRLQDIPKRAERRKYYKLLNT